MSNSSHMGVLGPSGNKGNPYVGHDIGTSENHVVGGTGPTGPTGPTGATGFTGVIGVSGGTGIGFGYCGSFSVFPGGQTFEGHDGITGDYRFYQYIAVTGATAINNTLAFYLGTNLRPGSDELQEPTFSYVPDLSPAVDNGVQATIVGQRGDTGTTGPIKIVTLGSGESIVSHITTHATGQHVYFKKFDNAGSDVEFGAGTPGITLGTLFIAGVSANAADAIDMGLTGELLYITSDGFADGATGTFYQFLDGYKVSGIGSGGVTLGDTLTAKLTNHKEIIRRHGNQRGATVFPTGWSSESYDDINLNLGDGNIQKVYCGPTSGYINLPTPGVYGKEGIEPNDAILLGSTYDHIIPFTLILHNAASHGLYTGLQTDEGLGNPEGPKKPWEIIRGFNDNVQVQWENKSDIEFSDRIDIFNFIYSPRTQMGEDGSSQEKIWYALTPSSNYGITFEGLEYERGSCCSTEYEGGCADYITREECSNLEDSSFQPATLCDDVNCETSISEGACCTMHTCIQSTQEECDSFQGYFVPDALCGTFNCNDYPCEEPDAPVGPCCIPSQNNSGDSCYECIKVDSIVCDCLEGTFAGVNGICSDCEEIEDPQLPLCPDEGACCIDEGCIPPGCNNTTTSFCDTQNGVFYPNKPCCDSGDQEDGRWLTCWMNEDGERNCVLADTREESRADLPELPPGCSQTILWTCGPGESWPECQVACYSQYGDAQGDHAPSCFQQICGAGTPGSDSEPSCPYIEDFPCEIPPGGLGCCCIEGVKHPFYTQDFCDLVGGDYTSGECADVTCTNEGAGVAGPELGCVDCQPRGACCIAGVCDDNDAYGYTQAECIDAGGIYQGAYTSCEDNTIDCCVYLSGSCCIQGICNDGYTPSECADTLGVFQGIGTNCSSDSIFCCEDDDSKNPDLGACCCDSDDPDCACSFIPYSQCVLRSESGCGNCEWYINQGCASAPDPNCIDDEEPGEDPTEPCGEPGGWHLFIDAEDSTYLGSEISNEGPAEIPWRTTSINEGESFADNTFRAYLPSQSDGYWNTHGFWRVISRVRYEVDAYADSDWSGEGFHAPMCGSRVAGRRSQRIFHKDGPFNLVNHQWRSQCKYGLDGVGQEGPVTQNEFNEGGDYDKWWNLTTYQLTREASYGKTEFSTDGKVLTPGFGTGLAYWPVTTDPSSWDVFNVAALSYDSTGGYSTGVCQSLNAGADHRGKASGEDLSPTDKSLNNLCALEPYVPSLDEMGYAHKMQLSSGGGLDLGMSGTYWTSTIPMGALPGGSVLNPDYAFTISIGGGDMIASESIFTPHKFRLMARWLDMVGTSTQNRIPLLPGVDLELGAVYRIGEDNQSQGHGRDMIYLGRFCPGKSSTVAEGMWQDSDYRSGSNIGSTRVSDPLRKGKCCTDITTNSNWPFEHNIYSCLAENLRPPAGGQSVNPTGWPIVNPLDGYAESGIRQDGESLYSWSHNPGDEPAWIAYQTPTKYEGDRRDQAFRDLTGEYRNFDADAWQLAGYIEHNAGGTPHGNQRIAFDQSGTTVIGCLGMYGMCHERQAASAAVEDYLTGQFDAPCNVVGNVIEDVTSDNYFFGGAHIMTRGVDTQCEASAEDAYHQNMFIGCQSQGRCCWTNPPGDGSSELPACTSACQGNEYNDGGVQIGGQFAKGLGQQFTSKYACIQSGGIWTPCEAIEDDVSAMPECQDVDNSDFFARTGICPGLVPTGACCVPGTPNPSCVLGFYSDPASGQGIPCPGTYYGDGSTNCSNPPCGTEETPCDEQSDCAADEFCCDNNGDGNSFCQGTPCAGSGDFDDDNCCDDNDDGINDYWCLNCPSGSEGTVVCPGASTPNPAYPDLGTVNYIGCGGALTGEEYLARRASGYGKPFVNDVETVRLGVSTNDGTGGPGTETVWSGFVIKPSNPAWVSQQRSDRICRPLYAGEDPGDGTNWRSPGCPCEPYLTQQDCFLNEDANCSPGCCHWDTDIVRDNEDISDFSLSGECFPNGPDFAERGCSSNPNLFGAGLVSFRTRNWMEPKFFNRHDFGRGFQWGSHDNTCWYGGGAGEGCLYSNEFLMANYDLVNYPQSRMIPSNNWSGTVELCSQSSASVYGRSGYPRTVGSDPANSTEIDQLLKPSEIRNANVDIGEGFQGEGSGPNQRTAINEYTKRLPGHVEEQTSQGVKNVITSGRGLFGWDPIDNLHYSTWVHSANIRRYGVNTDTTKTRWGNLQLGDAGNLDGSGVGGWYYLGSGYGEPGVAADNHFRWRGESQGDQPEGEGNAWWKVGNETRFVYGQSVNGPSYWCPPYAGLQLPPSNSESWWTGTTDGDGNYIPNDFGIGGSELIQAYGFELPDQSTADYPIGMSPCYARRFKINFESYSIDDRFQVIQVPWPKGARSTLEAYDRLRCYYNCITEGLCFNPETDEAADDTIRDRLADLPEAFNGGGPENRHLWLNGVKLIRTLNEDDESVITGIETSMCAEKCIGYPASPEWVLYDSLCINTPSVQSGDCKHCDEFNSTLHPFNGSQKHGTQIGEDDGSTLDFVQKCVHYTYPQCPLRLDYEQINNGFNFGVAGYDGEETPGIANMTTIEKRLAEGYGPAGHGPIPPMMVGFANCNPAGDGEGGSVWKAGISECSGWYNSVTGSNNSSSAIIGGPPNGNCGGGASGVGSDTDNTDGPIVIVDGDGEVIVPTGPDPNCDNRVGCSSPNLDPLGNERGQCFCPKCGVNASIYASRLECSCRWNCINLGCTSPECLTCTDQLDPEDDWYNAGQCQSCPTGESYQCYTGCAGPSGLDPAQNCAWVAPNISTKSPHDDTSGLISDCHKVYTPRESQYVGSDSTAYPIGAEFISGQYIDSINPTLGNNTCVSCITCVGSAVGCWPGPIDTPHEGSGWNNFIDGSPWHWDATNDTGQDPLGSIWHSASTFAKDNIDRNYQCLPHGIDFLALGINEGPAPVVNQSSDLVGLLCGWNSEVHTIAKTVDDNLGPESSAKVVLNQTTCPMLFVGIHGSELNHKECEDYWGPWRCLCANDNPGLAGSSLAWAGTGLGESTACTTDTNSDVFGCPRNLSFKRLFMQYGKAKTNSFQTVFTLEECSQGRYDSVYITDSDQIGYESNGFRDIPLTYPNANNIDPKDEFVVFPWLKNNSVDGMGTGFDLSEASGFINSEMELLPHQYLNGVPHTTDVSTTTLGLGEPCAGFGLGDPEQNGICLRMQKRAPNRATPLCCSDDPFYCENGRAGC